jgi:hypothetical protein
VPWGVKDLKGLENVKGERCRIYMEDNKRIREMCNNNISEFNYTQQHRC